MHHIIKHLFHPQRSNNHRPRLLQVESYVSLVSIVLGFALFMLLSGKVNPQVGYILGYASNISAGDVISQTNQERAKGGLAPLENNELLAQAAAGKARDMFSKQYWAHQSPDGVEPWAFINGAGYKYIAAGENLARDFNVTSDMMAAWMASPTHAANIMNARYQEIGVAVVNGTLEGIETTLVVQMFGRPAAPAAVAQVPPAATQTETVSLAVEPQPTAGPQQRSDSATAPTAKPAPTATPIKVEETPSSPVPTLTGAEVLAQTAVPTGRLQSSVAVFSPLELSKAFGLSILMLLVGTLLYDWYLSHQLGTVRLVGKNFAHIMYFSAICFVLVLFRGGFVF